MQGPFDQASCATLTSLVFLRFAEIGTFFCAYLPTRGIVYEIFAKATE